MVASSVSVSKVVNTLFDDEFGLSEDDNSDESDEDCIYGYLGAAVLHQPDSRVDFPAEDEEHMERSVLERTIDSDSSPRPSSTSDPDFQAASSSKDEDVDANSPVTTRESSSEVTTDETVSTYK